MKHDVQWDEENSCARLTLCGHFVVEEARVLLGQIEQMLDGKPNRYLLIDHKQSPNALPRETREFLKARSAEFHTDKIAFFGMSNLNRITAKIIVAVTGTAKQTGFFKTEAEALAWLEDG